MNLLGPAIELPLPRTTGRLCGQCHPMLMTRVKPPGRYWGGGGTSPSPLHFIPMGFLFVPNDYIGLLMGLLHLDPIWMPAPRSRLHGSEQTDVRKLLPACSQQNLHPQPGLLQARGQQGEFT